MGFFDRLRQWRVSPRESQPKVATQSASGGVLITSPDELDRFMRGEASGSSAGVPITIDTAMRVSAVFACVRIIAGAVATMPLQLKRRKSETIREDANDEPLAKVLKRRPNRWMTPSGFRRMMQAHILLRGNAYALIVRNTRKQVQALIPLHPDRVTAEQKDDLTIVYKYRRPNGATLEFPQQDIFHLIGLTLDGVNGVSVLTYARESIGLSIATTRHGSSLFRNGTQPGAVLTAKAQLGKEGIENLKASLEEYRGAEAAGKTLILEEDMKFDRIGLTSSDAQFVETIGANRTDIAMFFGVPPHMLGDTTKTTSWGSGIEQQSQGFVSFTLEDWLTGWEETIDRDLIGDADDQLFTKFNRAGLVRGDIKTRYGAYAVGRQWGWLSANDVRALEDLNPIEGGDEYLVPLNMVDPNAPPPKEEKEETDELAEAA